MVNFFYSLFSAIPTQNNDFRILRKMRVYSLMRFFVKRTANILIPIYYNTTADNPLYRLRIFDEKNSFRNRIVVTLTSFPTRIDKVWLTIEGILRQSVKPTKIILWLSKDQFENIDSLPEKLKNQTLRGLEIRLVEGDIRSHKKYYYAVSEFPDDYIITIDDDIYYRSDLIETMMRCHTENPDDIISFYCRNVKRNKQELCSYNSWGNTQESLSSVSELFFGSGGGTFFPPSSLHKDVIKSDLFLDLTPLADDIWLNAMSRLQNTSIRFISKTKGLLLPVVFKENNTLTAQNVGNNMNDVQIANVQKYYQENYGVDPFKKIESK